MAAVKRISGPHSFMTRARRMETEVASRRKKKITSCNTLGEYECDKEVTYSYGNTNNSDDTSITSVSSSGYLKYKNSLRWEYNMG